MDITTTCDHPIPAIATVARPRRRVSTRAKVIQGLLSLGALVGAISVADIAKPAEQASVAERLVTREVATTALSERLDEEHSPTVQYVAAKFATLYENKGYEVPDSVATAIAAAAEKHGVDPQVAFGLVRLESGFRNEATSRVGAMGLTQLMPKTAAWLRPGTTRQDLRDPDTNIDIGMAYLRTLIDRYRGDVNLALTAYNRGPGTVDKAIRKGRNPDNGYADLVYGRQTARAAGHHSSESRKEGKRGVRRTG